MWNEVKVVLAVFLFTVLWFVWYMKEYCAAKILSTIRENICLKIIVAIIPSYLVRNLPLSLSSLFLQTKNKIQFCMQIVSLVIRNLCFFFIASHPLPRRHTELIKFCEGIFLHVIPVCIILPCKVWELFIWNIFNFLLNREDLKHLITDISKPRHFILSRGILRSSVSITFWRSIKIVPECIPMKCLSKQNLSLVLHASRLKNLI